MNLHVHRTVVTRFLGFLKAIIEFRVTHSIPHNSVSSQPLGRSGFPGPPRGDPRYRSRPGNGGRLKRSPGNQPLVYVGVEQELEYDQIKLLVPINSNTFNGRIVGP